MLNHLTNYVICKKAQRKKKEIFNSLHDTTTYIRTISDTDYFIYIKDLISEFGEESYPNYILFSTE